MLARSLRDEIHATIMQYGNVSSIRKTQMYQEVSFKTEIDITDITPKESPKSVVRKDGSIDEVITRTIDLSSRRFNQNQVDIKPVQSRSFERNEIILLNEITRFLTSIDEISHLPIYSSAWRGMDLKDIQVYSYWKPLFQPRKVDLLGVSNLAPNIKDDSTLRQELGSEKERSASDLMLPTEFLSFQELFNQFLNKRDCPKVSIIDAIGEVSLIDIQHRISTGDCVSVLYDYKQIPIDLKMDDSFFEPVYLAKFDAERFCMTLFL